ncbi:MAG: AgmX/PglI C-terminal domain-containing protein [Polyangiaceae bacterium]
MKTTILMASVLAFAATACSFAARSPEMYRDDTGAALAKKNDDIRACYDGVLKGTPGAAGKVTVKFDVETETGKVANVTVDKAGSTAPDAVSECVTKAIAGVAIAPPDARKGEATWVYEFSAPPPAAAPAPAPAPKS